ncbi:hypothetical protein Hypma_003092 [Hypsizygus marmoreus]|uniref:Uncharacterized protein n=1 Tax=Hypsizygus marmoreus TaxID=39966 RepID=A0A369J2J5_HYPMA|nr:hypothetical protein Hypma_003092 [Hypsizygus marmoreus]
MKASCRHRRRPSSDHRLRALTPYLHIRWETRGPEMIEHALSITNTNDEQNILPRSFPPENADTDLETWKRGLNRPRSRLLNQRAHQSPSARKRAPSIRLQRLPTSAGDGKASGNEDIAAQTSPTTPPASQAINSSSRSPSRSDNGSKLPGMRQRRFTKINEKHVLFNQYDRAAQVRALSIRLRRRARHRRRAVICRHLSD